jgi:hypothetical protein
MASRVRSSVATGNTSSTRSAYCSNVRSPTLGYRLSGSTRLRSSLKLTGPPGQTLTRLGTQMKLSMGCDCSEPCQAGGTKA